MRILVIFFLFLYSCSTNMIFNKNETYRIINVEGKLTDIQKLFYLSDIREMSFDSLYIKYNRDSYNNCFIYNKNHLLLSEFRLKESEIKDYYIASNYFPLEKMGYSFKDSAQFQFQLTVKKEVGVFYLMFNNLENSDNKWLKRLDEKLIITLIR